MDAFDETEEEVEDKVPEVEVECDEGADSEDCEEEEWGGERADCEEEDEEEWEAGGEGDEKICDDGCWVEILALFTSVDTRVGEALLSRTSLSVCWAKTQKKIRHTNFIFPNFN